jgi:hypothetical protein
MTLILARYRRSGTLLTDADADDLAAGLDLRMLEILYAGNIRNVHD